MEIKKISETQTKNRDVFQPVKAIAVIFIFLFLVWGVWFAFIRPNPEESEETANSPLNLGLMTKKQKETVEPPKESYYRNFFKISLDGAVFETYPEKEFITVKIVQDNLSGVDISGWKLKNSRGEEAIIGKGAALPTSGKVNPLEPIIVQGGDTLIISTGRSPIGVSFKKNACSGYFEQFQDFIPPIQLECPYLSSNPSFGSLDFACQNFLYNLPQCYVNIKNLPAGTSAACKSFIASAATYNGCVSANKADSRFFFGNEWRIFLAREKEFWLKGQETFILTDDKDAIVDIAAMQQ